MKTVKYLFILVLLFTGILSIPSCKKENRCDCIKRTGPIVKETRVLAEFTRVEAEDNLNVFITQDTVQEVVIEAGENKMLFLCDRIDVLL